MRKLLVLTAAEGPYLPYVLPYATSVLHHNDDCIVEAFIPDKTDFIKKYALGVERVNDLFEGRFIISEVEFCVPGSIVRFITTPSIEAEYVYIGDVDVLVLEDIAQWHIPIMRKEAMRYSNEVRSSFLKDGINKLTGLHFSEFNFYYPIKIPEDINIKELKWNADEDLLYRIVSAKTEPKPGDIGRPIHGFHMSQHGWPYNQWGVKNPAYRRKYDKLRKTNAWSQMRILFDPRYIVYLEILEATIKGYEHFTIEEIKGSSTLYGRGAQTHLK